MSFEKNCSTIWKIVQREHGLHSPSTEQLKLFVKFNYPQSPLFVRPIDAIKNHIWMRSFTKQITKS